MGDRGDCFKNITGSDCICENIVCGGKAATIEFEPSVSLKKIEEPDSFIASSPQGVLLIN